MEGYSQSIRMLNASARLRGFHPTSEGGTPTTKTPFPHIPSLDANVRLNVEINDEGHFNE